MRFIRYKFFLGIIIIAWSCSPQRFTSVSTSIPQSAEEYISRFSEMAVSEMKRTGIPASITLAQGIIESDMGRSRLAREGNNHFGIKCHNGWTGPTIRHDDDRRNECFRKYRNANESYHDHSEFLVKTPRYKFLFDIPSDDYRGWARGLKKAGYATNPDYANMLIRKIEQYNLERFDSRNYMKNEVKETDRKEKVDPEEYIPGNNSTGSVRNVVPAGKITGEENRVQYIIVNEGDTRESIEKAHKLLSWELARYNELADDFEINPGQRLYLQPKRDRADVTKEYHTLKEGETLYQVSQLYAVKLSRLLLYNRIEQGDEPAAGTKIWLRTIRPLN